MSSRREIIAQWIAEGKKKKPQLEFDKTKNIENLTSTSKCLKYVQTFYGNNFSLQNVTIIFLRKLNNFYAAECLFCASHSLEADKNKI